jgi:hypothetical protein
MCFYHRIISMELLNMVFMRGALALRLLLLEYTAGMVSMARACASAVAIFGLSAVGLFSLLV